jgi:hypothetical protein
MKPIVILYNYQTVIAGAFALGAAIWTVIMINKQIKQANDQETDRRHRRNRAARSMMPAALSALCDYSERSVNILLPLLTRMQQEEPAATEIVEDIPTIPVDALSTLRECIEFGEDEIEANVAALIRKLQVQHSRLRGIKAELLSEKTLPSDNVTAYVLDALEVYARSTSLLSYARRETEDAATELTEFDFVSAAHNCNIWDNRSPEISLRSKLSSNRSLKKAKNLQGNVSREYRCQEAGIWRRIADFAAATGGSHLHR